MSIRRWYYSPKNNWAFKCSSHYKKKALFGDCVFSVEKPAPIIKNCFSIQLHKFSQWKRLYSWFSYSALNHSTFELYPRMVICLFELCNTISFIPKIVSFINKKVFFFFVCLMKWIFLAWNLIFWINKKKCNQENFNKNIKIFLLLEYTRNLKIYCWPFYIILIFLLLWV